MDKYTNYMKKLNSKINKKLNRPFVSNEDLHDLFHHYDLLMYYDYYANYEYYKNKLKQYRQELDNDL